MKKIIVANWKMYLNVKESIECAEFLRDNLKVDSDTKVILCPNALAFNGVNEVLHEEIDLCAQNVAWSPLGAYTGAISALLFHEDGATHALVGHSERRYIFNETDDAVRKKIEACVDTNLIPIVCVGETHDDKKEDKAEYRIKKQIMKAFEGIDLEGVTPIVAYEPVWAISNFGVGEPCDPEYANKMQELIKEEVKKYVDVDVAVLYGGSVDNTNVASYLSQANIDGVLVGSASTNKQVFLDLIEKASLI